MATHEELDAVGRSSRGSFSPKWREYKRQAQLKFVSTVDKIVTLSRGSSSSNLRHILAHTNNYESMPLTVGPVIGKVTDTSARILVEVPEVATVSIELEEEKTTSEPGRNEKVKKGSSSNVLKREKLLGAKRPAIFEFKDLKPETRYNVKLKGCHLTVVPSSSFRTFPSRSPDLLNFAVISCNKIFITEKEIPVHSDLWAHLKSTIEQKKIDMCLHLGDQIYGDGDKMLDAEAGSDPDDWSDCFRRSKSLLDALPKNEWVSMCEDICEFYRNVYRKTWQHLPTAYCLANCPNLMIYDDHEIRDNWGDLEEDWITDSSDFLIAKCAWRVALEYQRQLHEDVDFSKLKAIDKDYHFHSIAGVGIMFIDIRGSRTFYRHDKPESRYLGPKQWKEIDLALSADGLFSEVNVLLLCSPAPLVFLDNNFTDVASNVPRLVDFRGHWSAAAHYEEQKRMVDALFKWKGSHKTREVLVLGGDVHCGGHSDIKRERQAIIRQLTTSAIANHPLPKSAYYLLRAAGNLTPATGRNFAFRHHDWTRSRNYGLVQIKNDGEQSGPPEVISQLIKGKFMIGPKEGKKVSSYERSRISGCEAWLCPTGRSIR